MLFWQLTINANDPVKLAAFWAKALEYSPVPPESPETPWNALYRRRLASGEQFDNRLFDPEGLRPPLFFQESSEPKDGNLRLHLDLYPTQRDDSLTPSRRNEIIDTKVAELVDLGATVVNRVDHGDERYWVVLADPEGNIFCVS